MITARFTATCPACALTISEGAPIEQDPASRQWVHLGCLEELRDTRLSEAPRTVCPDLPHPAHRHRGVHVRGGLTMPAGHRAHLGITDDNVGVRRGKTGGTYRTCKECHRIRERGRYAGRTLDEQLIHEATKEAA